MNDAASSQNFAMMLRASLQGNAIREWLRIASSTGILSQRFPRDRKYDGGESISEQIIISFFQFKKSSFCIIGLFVMTAKQCFIFGQFKGVLDLRQIQSHF